MLDFAEVVAINKFERRGAMDALRDVGRQLVRNREAFGKKPEDMPVFGTSAATFNDDGVTALYLHLRGTLAEAGLPVEEYGPLEVKMAVTGSGTADKGQVRAALGTLHGLRDVPQQLDAADAVAVAVCHLSQTALRRAARAVARR
jgi:hypothetical protein